jgi:tellurite resistance protein
MKPTAKGLLGWIAGTVTEALDNGREQRIESFVASVDSLFAKLRQAFDYSRAVAELGISEGDRGEVAERVYRRFLERAWQDAEISAREGELLAWVSQSLGLSAAVVASANSQAAGTVFKKAFVKAIADGRVDDSEAARLQKIASHTGQPVGSLLNQFFEKEADSLLRSIFSQAAADGRLEREEWKEFRQTAERLGIGKEQMLEAIRQPAHQLVEHALADARSDGEISEREEKMLLSLSGAVIDDPVFAEYVREQIEHAKAMHQIGKGLLPSLPAPMGVAVRAGEIVHWSGPAEFRRERELASGTRIDEIDGDAVITDTRMILNAAERSFEVSHRKVLAYFPAGSEIEIRASGKGAGRFGFPEDGERAVAIWRTAIGRANQTIVASDDSQTRRRISREVRQRVWQRYGGRCAECTADTYLEFDHIIPVAKGGGNSETNVQLLCRRCNLAKSDNI